MKYEAKILLLIMAVSFISGCDKNGDLITAPVVTEGAISLNSMTDERYVVMIDDKPFGDTLQNVSQLKNILVEKKSGPQHLVIRNVKDNSLLIDSMIILSTPAFSYLLLQLDADEAPVMFSNADEESLPGADSVKLRFLYTDTNLPDSIKMRFYNIDGNTFETERFDSVIVYRKNIGQYIAGPIDKYPGGTIYGFDILNAADGETLQAIDLDPSSGRFAEGVMDKAPAPGGTLTAKKQTLLLEFGNSSYVSDTYTERYLFGSNE